jgi:hypothetical protein
MLMRLRPRPVTSAAALDWAIVPARYPCRAGRQIWERVSSNNGRSFMGWDSTRGSTTCVKGLPGSHNHLQDLPTGDRVGLL